MLCCVMLYVLCYMLCYVVSHISYTLSQHLALFTPGNRDMPVNVPSPCTTAQPHWFPSVNQSSIQMQRTLLSVFLQIHLHPRCLITVVCINIWLCQDRFSPCLFSAAFLCQIRDEEKKHLSPDLVLWKISLRKVLAL